MSPKLRFEILPPSQAKIFMDNRSYFLDKLIKQANKNPNTHFFDKVKNPNTHKHARTDSTAFHETCKA